MFSLFVLSQLQKLFKAEVNKRKGMRIIQYMIFKSEIKDREP